MQLSHLNNGDAEEEIEIGKKERALISILGTRAAPGITC